MSWDFVLETFARFLFGHAHEIAGATVSAAIVLLSWRREDRARERRHRRQIMGLEDELSRLRVEHQAGAQQFETLGRQKGELECKQESLELACRRREVERDRLRETVTSLSDALEESMERGAELEDSAKGSSEVIENLAEMDGRIWERPVMPGIPPFRPLYERRTPIISVVNLKGGVGKTTITANLGATLWGQEARVLLVDLDYQGSLTSLCLPASQRTQLVAGRRLVQRVLEAGADSLAALDECVIPIPRTSAAIVGAGEQLADAETQIMARWLIDRTDTDVRYTLRRALHAPEVSGRFDYILVDCPPRLTTACVNALTSSDLVLIPVLLDETSAEAVPRLLRWLRTLRSHICPDLGVLGVLANKAHLRENRLIARHRSVWEQLPDRCTDAWGERVHHFRAVVPHSTHIGGASLANGLPALTPELRARFLDIEREIRTRIPRRESERSFAIP